MEVGFSQHFRIGRDIAFRKEIQIPLDEPRLDVDLRNLVPVKVCVNDPVINKDHPLHLKCWAGLAGELLSACTRIEYTVESTGADGKVGHEKNRAASR